MFKINDRTIKGRVVRNSTLLLILYIAGLLVILGIIFPASYVRNQKKINLNILNNVNQYLSEIFNDINVEYGIISNNENIIKAINGINVYNQSSKEGKPENNSEYLDNFKFVSNYIEERSFLSNNIISNISYVIDGIVINPPRNVDLEKFAKYINNSGKSKILFFGTNMLSENNNEKIDYIMKFPMYGLNGEFIGSICFMLNREKKYFDTDGSELIIVDSNNEVMFGSSNNYPAFYDANNEDEISSGEIKTINGKKYLATSSEIIPFNWKMISFMSFDYFYKSIYKLMLFAFIIAVIMFMAARLLMNKMSMLIYYNIQKLINESEAITEHGEKKGFKVKKPSRFVSMTNKYKLSRKFQIYNLIVIIIPIILVSIVVYITEIEITKEEFKYTAQRLNNYSCNIIKNQMYDYNHLLKSIISNNNLMKTMYEYSNSNDESERKILFYNIGEKIKSPNLNYEIEYYNDSGRFIFSYPYMSEQKEMLSESDITKNNTVIWDSEKRKYVFHIIRRMFLDTDDFRGGIGYCVMQIDDTVFYNALDDVNTNIDYKIYDKTGTIFFSSNSKEIGNETEKNVHKKNTEYFYNNFDEYGISFHVTISKDDINAINNKNAMMILLLVISIVAINIIVSKRLNVYIQEPIAMANNALLTDDNTELIRHKGDELDSLVTSVNKMKKRINALINEIYKNKILIQDLELKVFQSQVAPHFLCNTLEIINALIDMGDERAGDLVVLLGDFFRQGISRSGNIITIEEEIEYTKVYLGIHQIILDDLLDVRWEIPNDVSKYKTIHFMLQPIIENSLKYGQYLKQDIRKIKVGAYEVGNTVVFFVRDNGNGMSKERLNEIRQHINSGDINGKSKGLKNINGRIKLTFGDAYGLKIYSEENKGTCVVIRFSKDL